MIDQHGTLEISESRLRHNLDLLRAKLSAGTIICATTKADAYGHSMRSVEPLLVKNDVEWRCVYTVAEAVQAVGASDTSNYVPKILVLAPIIRELSPVDPPNGHQILKAILRNVRINVVDLEGVNYLNSFASRSKNLPEIFVHVQVDTGLTRSGASVVDVPFLVERILSLPNIGLEGIFTHLSHGDEAGHSSIADQIEALHQIADPIKREHPNILIHAQNSGGTWNFSDASLDMVRIGIAMYGLQPSLDDPIPGLLPIARLVAPILMIHERPTNTGVGYGHTFTTQRASRLAIVPVGYADGYPRAMSNRGIVQVRGHNVPVVGRVSMDQIIVDVTDVAGAMAGDQVTVFSDDPAAANCIDQVAKACGTIGYEIATGLGARLMRRVVG